MCKWVNKNRMQLEKRGHMEVGQRFFGTNIVVQAPGEKNNTVQLKFRNEIKRWARQVSEG